MAKLPTKGKSKNAGKGVYQSALASKSFNETPICRGQRWSIIDEHQLSQDVARLMLGQYRHVAKVLSGVSGTPPSVTEQMIDQTITKLRPKGKKQKEHRDGWLFQFIAWIAAQSNAKQHLLLSPPHNRPADKGFDALIIHLDSDKTVPTHLTVSEEKATVHPRKLFQQQVLPEFAQLDERVRDTEIIAEVTTLLEASELQDIDKFLTAVFWTTGKRRYRACLTVVNQGSTSQARKALLKNFNDTITGALSRRRADLFKIDDLRVWMDDFSELIVSQLEELRASSV